MTIGIEKILTISAKEWFEITGKNPNEYEARGVHYDCRYSFPENVLKSTPSEVEVVVGCRLTPNICGSGENNSMAGSSNINTMIYFSGTALIPKKK